MQTPKSTGVRERHGKDFAPESLGEAGHRAVTNHTTLLGVGGNAETRHTAAHPPPMHE